MKKRGLSVVVVLIIAMLASVLLAACGKETYQIEFVDYDGSELKTVSVTQDEAVEWGATVPTREADAENTYTFAGWADEDGVVWPNDQLPNATASAKYTATYSATVNKYDVVFINGGETLLTTNLSYGAEVVYDGEEPTKASTAENDYAFAGWATAENASEALDALPTVTGAATYYAVFTATTREYTVNFIGDGGANLQNTAFAYGATPVYSGSTPTKAATAQYTYAFAGWATTENASEALDALSAVTGEATYYAVFTATTNTYPVNFIGDGGTNLQNTAFAYGATPVYSGSTPSKAATAQYTYAFAGWATTANASEALDALSAVTGEATYYAVFTATTNTYPVNFIGDGGVNLQNTAFAYGATPVYSGSTPTKAATAQFTYAFAGWATTANASEPLDELSAVTGEATYYAVFSSTTNTFTIQFKDEDGTTLQSSEFAYGTTPVYSGTAPTKAATAQYTYTFAGWVDSQDNVWPSNQIPNVSAAATYTAKYNSTVNKYDVTFINGTQTLQTENLAYGTEVTYNGEEPTKASTAENEYDFLGWATTAEATEALDAIPAVTGNATYYAIFQATLQKYTITWNIEGQTSTERVEYGKVPAYSGEAPVKQNTIQYTYTFLGWATTAGATEALDAIPAVTGNASYYAIFTATPNTFKIEFVNADGSVLQDTKFEYGAIPVYNGNTPTKAADAQYTYTFNGWLVDGAVFGSGDNLPQVEGEARYVASFAQTVNKYVVTWNIDGETSQVSFDYGATPVYSGTPERAPTALYQYTFLGWATTANASVALEQLPTVTGTATYYAVFAQETRTYSVEFYVGDDLVDTDNVTAGAVPSFGGSTPEKEATAEYTYAFAGWSLTAGGDLVNLAEEEITGDTKYYAVFNATKNTYRIVFLSENGEMLQDSNVEYGALPVYSGEEQTKANTDYCTYAFAGWTDSVTTHAALPTVTGAAVYRAVFSSTNATYTVTINYVVKDGGAEAPESKTITGKYGTEYGKEQTLTPEIDGYLPNYFWLGGVITANTTLTVTYTKADVWDGTYPEVASYTLAGAGTEADPYLIQSAQDLAYLTKKYEKGIIPLNTYLEMTTSIDLDGHEFLPICFHYATGTSLGSAHKGVFKGEGYTIAGLYYSNTTYNAVGLFGYISAGQVYDLTIEGNLTGKSRVGGLTYWVNNGIVKNVISYVNTTGSTLVGGISGTIGTDSEMTNCASYGTVTASGTADKFGGISGAAGNVAMTNCFNYGTVKADANGEISTVGGIAGELDTGSLINCINYGTVLCGRSGVGGIAGIHVTHTAKIEGCVNYGAVSGQYRVGGILGHNDVTTQNIEITITDCINYGTVTALGETFKNNATVTDGYTVVAVSGAKSYSAGGIAGWFGKGSITDCTNYGAVTGNVRSIGGIMGHVAKFVTISGAKNYGTVTAVDYADMVGGIVGFCAGSVIDSNNYGDVVGKVLLGGIAGDVSSTSANEPAVVTGCNNYGKIIGSATFHLKNGTAYDAYQMLGGIAGRVTGAGVNFASSKNFGSVTATNEDSLYVGGIVGWTDQAISGFENYGTVVGYEYVGGIAGYGAELVTEGTNVGIIIVQLSA